MFQIIRNLLSLSLSLSLSLFLLTACGGDGNKEISELKSELAELREAQAAGDVTAAKKIRVNELQLQGIIQDEDIYYGNMPPEEEENEWEFSAEYNRKLKEYENALRELSHDSPEEKIAAVENLRAELVAMQVDRKWVKRKPKKFELEEEPSRPAVANSGSVCPPNCALL